MTYFIKNGETFNFTSEGSFDLHRSLPVGTYIIEVNQQTGALYFQTVKDFKNTGKIYGDHEKNCTRILSTYHDRVNNTGVLLEGEKGSGKTLLAKMIAETGAKQGMPTILITRPYRGDQFNQLVQALQQEAIFIFDEFEKVYEREAQEQILTLLDGVFPSKKLFVFTVNDKYKLDSHLNNRPGRIFYSISYVGLDVDFIREYCDDKLNNKKHIDKICSISSMFRNFNFDMLKGLVEEMNRYNENPAEALKLLNINPEEKFQQSFKVKLIDPKFPNLFLDEDEWCGAPLIGRPSFFYWENLDKYNDDESEGYDVTFTNEHIVKITESGEYHYKNEAGLTLVLTKIKPKKLDYYAF